MKQGPRPLSDRLPTRYYAACPTAAPTAAEPAAREPTPGPDKPDKPGPKPRPVATPAPTKQHADELARIDQEIAATSRRAEAHPHGWLVLDRLAGLHLGRARLSGELDDYAKAEAALERAFTVAGEDAGPHLTRIALNFTLHRLDRVAADLKHVEKYAIKTPAERRALRELGAPSSRSSRAATRTPARASRRRWPPSPGMWPTAPAWACALEDRRLRRREESLRPGPRRADRRRARGLAAPSARAHGPRARPSRRGPGPLPRRRRAALRLLAARRAHRRGSLTLKDDRRRPRALRRRRRRHTNNPEFMDAVAGIHRAAGRTEAAAPLIARADAIYAEAQLLRFPEAAYGHALTLPRVRRRPEADRHARRADHRTRPNAEAKISLARAYLQAGRKDDARKAIDKALATPWNTADLHAVAAEVLTATGDAVAASEQRRLALAINPAVLD